MKFLLMTLGCPKNTVDSEMMAQLLVEAGHGATAEATEADLLIVNTCGFIRDARQESYAAMKALARSKRPDQALIAAGCLAQLDCDSIRRRIPEVDAVLGTRSWSEIVQIVDELQQRRHGVCVHVREQGNLVASTRRMALTGRSAYLKIADGCDAGCAYCAIPLIKGPQVSKPVETILREARELVQEGVREIVLIAQDTTAYGRDLGMQDGLPGLLGNLVEEMPADGWLRILYAYPQHISDALVQVMASHPSICHYLDLPLQHGDSDVLRRMRRPHDVDMVHDRIAALRAAMPDIALRSTFIVGFPGETEREFAALLDLLGRIAFDHVGVFTYSRERGTAAADMPGQVPAAIARERHNAAMEAQQQISLSRNREQIGRELRVLVEDTARGQARGRSYRDAPEIDGSVIISGDAPADTFVRVQITGARPYDLLGRVIPTVD
ncbi:MAG: 30S ribosomal protein S12 methylthiotransferase RimO [Chloroflexi bacterium]|nr:30S ribosomal protein S12 methylthiotransferase RimO [Chloroflexota bacterium]